MGRKGNLSEELSRMKKLMSFKMDDNSHKKLSADFIKESTKKRKVVSEQKDVKDTDQLQQTTKDTGWRNVISGIKYDQVDEKGDKVPSSIAEIQKNLETSSQTMYKDTTKG
jgi:predicted secreted protein